MNTDALPEPHPQATLRNSPRASPAAASPSRGCSCGTLLGSRDHDRSAAGLWPVPGRGLRLLEGVQSHLGTFRIIHL